MIGRTIAHYRILEKLGEGGMGVVYLAEDTRLGRRVALKALPAEFARDPLRRKRFELEARAAASLCHPGIASVYSLEEAGDELYIAFEYVRGESLRTLVRPGGLEPAELVDIARGIARALAAAHELGIVHRDLKPENILRTPEGDTKILDFGLARFESRQAGGETQSLALTGAGQIVGTVAYMAPEQLDGREADFRCDVFAFGVLLYELSAGTHPFTGLSATSTISRILTAEPTPLAQRNPLVPAEFDRIVRKCLRKRREERYQSTRDLAGDLEDLRRDSDGARTFTATEAVGPGVGQSETPAGSSDTGLLERILVRRGSTPRWWWELNHIFQAVLIYPLFGFLGWKAKQELTGPWGVGLFVSLLLCAAPCIGLRLHLLNHAAFNPRGVGVEVRRVAAALRVSGLGYWASVLIMAVGILPEHTDLGPLLLGFSLAGFIVVLFIEPSIERTAFPPEKSAGPTLG